MAAIWKPKEWGRNLPRRALACLSAVRKCPNRVARIYEPGTRLTAG
jgi:hypothetical protein